MEIKNVTDALLRLPTKERESTDPYDLDVRIQELVKGKEGMPNREDGATITCSRCGSCHGSCAC